MYFAFKLKFVKGRGYQIYNTKEVKTEQKEEAKADKETKKGEQEAPVPLANHVNIILHSIFSNVEVYTENLFWCQQLDLRQIRILRRGQPIVDFVAADNCCL